MLLVNCCTRPRERNMVTSFEICHLILCQTSFECIETDLRKLENQVGLSLIRCWQKASCSQFTCRRRGGWLSTLERYDISNCNGECVKWSSRSLKTPWLQFCNPSASRWGVCIHAHACTVLLILQFFWSPCSETCKGSSDHITVNNFLWTRCRGRGYCRGSRLLSFSYLIRKADSWNLFVCGAEYYTTLCSHVHSSGHNEKPF